MMRLLTALFCLALVGGCAVRTPAAFVTSYAEPYRLDSGDELRVTVFGEAELTDTYAVDQAGYVTVPLVGAVPARGLSPADLAGAIAGGLREGFLRDPDISVEVSQYRPFFIQGEVRNPGQFPYISGLTAATAVAVAGGFTPRASERAATVTRIINGEQLTGRIAITDPIRPGDSIVIEQRLF
jgi:polysaccharide export outer membrane protein